MTSWQDFANGMDWWGLLDLLISAAAALFGTPIHVLAPGLGAYRLGPPTAKNAGRLSLNPIKHIDPVGLLMMLVAKVGWAKPVPVDMRYFKNPKKGMAITALAGPASNFVLAFLAVAVSTGLYRLLDRVEGIAIYVLLSFLANVALLSVGLGIFNLIPISPLDGSKVLYSFLPEKAYYTILRYERYVMILVILLTVAGAFSTPLSWLMEKTLSAFCGVFGEGYSLNSLLLLANLFDWVRF